jgi:hypothetical protein
VIVGATAAPAPSPLITKVTERTLVAAKAAFADGNRLVAAVTAEVIAVEAVFAIVVNVTTLAVAPRACRPMLGVIVTVTVSAPLALATVKFDVPVAKAPNASDAVAAEVPGTEATALVSAVPVPFPRVITPVPDAEIVTNSPAIAGEIARFESSILTVTAFATVAPIVSDAADAEIEVGAPVTVKLKVPFSSPASTTESPSVSK